LLIAAGRFAEINIRPEKFRFGAEMAARRAAN
jgi:hypothetical protein